MKAEYIQCELRRGNLFDVVGLPAKFAVKGNYVKLLGVDGWLITEVYREFQPENRRNYQLPSIAGEPLA